jgi:hypothetical protein
MTQSTDRQRPLDFLRVRNVDPRSLGVHAAINVAAAEDALPTYVLRNRAPTDT